MSVQPIRSLLLILLILTVPSSALADLCGERWPQATVADCREALLVDDLASTDAGDQTLIALAQLHSTGFSVWAAAATSAQLDLLYQDVEHPAREVRVLRHWGTDYAFAAGPRGVFVYDLTQARSLVHPCADHDGDQCPGILQGRLGDARNTVALDVFERDGNIYVVTSGVAGAPVEIWAISNPAIPEMAVRKFSGPAGPAHETASGRVADAFASGRDVAFVEVDGELLLAVSRSDGPARLDVYAVETCLGFGGCDGLGDPLWNEVAEQLVARLSL